LCSDADEQLQFDTISAGNVPTLFLGRAYTNGAVNIMALQKMQKLLVCVLSLSLMLRRMYTAQEATRFKPMFEH
jgi:hypothetical protein